MVSPSATCAAAARAEAFDPSTDWTTPSGKPVVPPRLHVFQRSAPAVHKERLGNPLVRVCPDATHQSGMTQSLARARSVCVAVALQRLQSNGRRTEMMRPLASLCLRSQVGVRTQRFASEDIR